MPRYFFDITDGRTSRDDIGVDCIDFAAVRREAMKALPDIAREEIPNDGDQRVFTVVVRDEEGRPVYHATLSFVGHSLLDRPA